MKNTFGQQLKENAVHLKADSYKGECYTQPQACVKGELYFKGTPKVYNMAYIARRPHIVVESYYGQGVVVHYEITGQSYSWTWSNRALAWQFAQERKAHISMLH